jgi:tetratricopeptide (TPR) repeat protein
MKQDTGRHLIAMVAVFFMLLSLNGTAAQAVQTQPSVDEYIAFFTTKLEKHPTLFAVYAQLAGAYIDKARATNDTKWLQMAEENLDKSIRIQPNFDASKIYASLHAYRHHFAEARKYGADAASASPEDAEVTALLVEADLGLGDIEQAEKRLPKLDSVPPNFYIAAAMANVLKAKHQYLDAREIFLKAEALALAQHVNVLAVWSRTNAAGMLIDSKQAAKALPDLELANALQKDNVELRRHWAEYYEALGEPGKALAIMAQLLKETPHPAFHHQAYLLSKKMGKHKVAKQHFAAAEQGYLKPIAEKEIFTLGSLAQLYCDAATKLDEALVMARRNLEYKRDGEAMDTMACVNEKIAKKLK